MKDTCLSFHIFPLSITLSIFPILSHHFAFPSFNNLPFLRREEIVCLTQLKNIHIHVEYFSLFSNIFHWHSFALFSLQFPWCFDKKKTKKKKKRELFQLNRKKESEEIFEKKADLNVKVREKWYDLGGEKKKKKEV